MYAATKEQYNTIEKQAMEEELELRKNKDYSSELSAEESVKERTKYLQEHLLQLKKTWDNAVKELDSLKENL